MQQLGPTQLDAWLKEASANEVRPILLDVREPWEFELCHIAGSRLMPMNSIPARYAELDTEAATVVICHHGQRSFQVASFLEGRGFSRVINLTGGVDAWAQQVDRTMATY